MNKMEISEEDKRKWWGDGEWVQEPNQASFNYLGYDCRVYRILHPEWHPNTDYMFGGHLCGYVRIPSEHPYFEKHYHDMTIDCHGDLTYAKHGIADSLEGFWIGFDCAHSSDYIPSVEKIFRENKIGNPFSTPKEYKKYSIFNQVYRNFEFVIHECQNIVDQLIKVQNEGICVKALPQQND
jgi:hypothetical protein